jgi:hypothetical protein
MSRELFARVPACRAGGRRLKLRPEKFLSHYGETLVKSLHNGDPDVIQRAGLASAIQVRAVKYYIPVCAFGILFMCDGYIHSGSHVEVQNIKQHNLSG